MRGIMMWVKVGIWCIVAGFFLGMVPRDAVRAHAFDLRNPQNRARGPRMPLRLCTMAIYATHPKQPLRPPGILPIFYSFRKSSKTKHFPLSYLNQILTTY